MDPNDAQILRESPDGLLLKRTLLKVLRSPAPGDVNSVAGVLGNEAFLLRLDDAESYQTTTISLRLNKVVRALADARTEDSQRALLALTSNAGFVAHPLRVKMLILGLARLRPLQPAALAFWRSHAQPGSSLATDVALATTLNRSPDALQLFGALISAQAHPQSLRISWLRRFLLPIRDDYNVVTLCDGLLRGGSLTPQMQQKVLEVLFQFEPDRWYKTCRHPEPPNRLRATDESKRLLHDIATRWSSMLNLPIGLLDVLREARDDLDPANDASR